MRRCIFKIFFLAILAVSCSQPEMLTPVRVVTELDIGKSKEITLRNGEKVTLLLERVEIFRDSLREAIRDVNVTLEVNGEKAILHSGNYNLPVEVGGVQVDCPVVKAYYENSNEDRWGLTHDARFRIWPAGSPYMSPGTFIYPVKQAWFAGMTQSGNEPPYVDWGENLSSRNIYYHSGHDFGGAEGMDEIVSAMRSSFSN